jgi:hypothetical protein
VINEGDNLAVLKSMLGNPIKVVAGVETSYEVHCHRDQIVFLFKSTIIDFWSDLRRNKIKALEARNPDNTDQVLEKDRFIATLTGKILPVFCDGETVRFELVFDDGSRLKSDIKLPPAAGMRNWLLSLLEIEYFKQAKSA